MTSSKPPRSSSSSTDDAAARQGDVFDQNLHTLLGQAGEIGRAHV